MVSTNSSVISAFLAQECFFDSVSSKSLTASGSWIWYNSPKAGRVILAHIDHNSPTILINKVKGDTNFEKFRNALVFELLSSNKYFNKKSCGMALNLTEYKFVDMA